MTARSRKFPKGCAIFECPNEPGIYSLETGGPVAPSSEWHERALRMFPDARIYGDGPFAMRLPCDRLSICLFFNPEVAEAAYRFSKKLDLACNGNCRQVKTKMVSTLLDFLTSEPQKGKAS